MDELYKILSKYLQNNPHFRARQKEEEVYRAWKQSVGERIAQNCWPIRFFEDGVLLIGSENNIWLQQLRYIEPQIIDKLRQTLKDNRVKQLRFKLETPSNKHRREG